jgi:hypothetical protein
MFSNKDWKKEDEEEGSQDKNQYSPSSAFKSGSEVKTGFITSGNSSGDEYSSGGEYTSEYEVNLITKLESSINTGKIDGTLSEQIDYQYALYLAINETLKNPSNLNTADQENMLAKKMEIQNFLKIFARSDQDEKIDRFMRAKQEGNLLDPEFIPGLAVTQLTGLPNQDTPSFPNFYFMKSNPTPLTLNQGNYAKAYIFIEEPPGLLYIDTLYDKEKKETKNIPISLNIKDEKNYNILISKIPDELKTSSQSFQKKINTELKRSFIDFITNDNRPGYTRISIAEHPPTLQNIKPDEITLIKEKDKLTAYWIQNAKIVEKSFPSNNVQHIISKLPNGEKSSTDKHLIKDITSIYGCINPGYTLKGKEKFKSLISDALAVEKGSMMIVNKESREKDIKLSTRMFTSKERANKRVIILPTGLFSYAADPSHLVNTEGMTSHQGINYASFVINKKGELSLFEHFGMKDRIAHSTFFSGTPTIGAGEMKIKNGKLIELTDYSGHYRPDLKNITETLKYLKQLGVDISATKVILRGEKYDASTLIEQTVKYTSRHR